MAIRSLSTSSISTGSKRSKFWDQSAVLATNSYESIASTAGGSNVLNFNSIPSTYKHLQIRGTMKDTGGTTTGIAEFYLRFNGDTTGANYWKSRFYVNNATYTAQDAAVGGEGIWGVHYPRSGSTGWGIVIIDIPNYSDTSIWKAVSMYGGGGVNASNAAGNCAFGFSGGQWKSTSAINQITIESNMAGFTSDSVFALYGIKG